MDEKQSSKDFSGVMLVMEYAGVYTYGVEKFLHDEQVDYVKRSALDIKDQQG